MPPACQWVVSEFMDVPMSIQHDYYLIGTGGTYATPGSIPLIQSQKYREKLTGFSYWTDVDLLVDSGISGGPLPTTPTRATYNTWIENVRNLGWNSGRVIYDWIPGGGSPSIVDSSEASPGQLCIEDSRFNNGWEISTSVKLHLLAK
jgi:hypothetical protein